MTLVNRDGCGRQTLTTWRKTSCIGKLNIPSLFGVDYIYIQDSKFFHQHNPYFSNHPDPVGAVVAAVNAYLRRDERCLHDFGIDDPAYGPANEEDTAHQPFDLLARIAALNEEQRVFFDHVQQRLARSEGGLLFLDAPGGTGKTFLMNAIIGSAKNVRLTCDRSRPLFKFPIYSNYISLYQDNYGVVTCASVGIAATLLEGATTAHNKFKIPLEIVDSNSICPIPEQSARAGNFN